MSLGNGAGPAPPMPTIPISMVPTAFGIIQVQGPDGRPVVALMVSTPTGQAVYLMDGDCAITTGQNLRQAGRATKAGLVLPSDGAV